MQNAHKEPRTLSRKSRVHASTEGLLEAQAYRRPFMSLPVHTVWPAVPGIARRRRGHSKSVAPVHADHTSKETASHVNGHRTTCGRSRFCACHFPPPTPSPVFLDVVVVLRDAVTHGEARTSQLHSDSVQENETDARGWPRSTEWETRSFISSFQGSSGMRPALRGSRASVTTALPLAQRSVRHELCGARTAFYDLLFSGRSSHSGSRQPSQSVCPKRAPNV
ncbi:hypothetical protein MRX96_021069 [Rhipicephalus microplus]